MEEQVVVDLAESQKSEPEHQVQEQVETVSQETFEEVDSAVTTEETQQEEIEVRAYMSVEVNLQIR